MTTTLTLFTTQLENFFTELSETYDDKNFKVAKESVIMLKKINPRKLKDQFVKYVYPYKENILSKNSDFFMNMEYRNETLKYGCKDKNEVDSWDKMFKSYRNLWLNDISDNSKEAIWQYLQVLIKLSEKA